MSERKEYQEDAIYTRGAAEALAYTNPIFAERLIEVANKLEAAAKHICAQGYFGCKAGERCTSDHK